MRGRETVITTRLEATLSLKMRKTSLCHVDPPLCRDGLALNTVRCLVPGCILTNERLLLGFGGVNPLMAQSILRVKTSCSARTRNVQIPQGANLIKYLLVAEIHLLFWLHKQDSEPPLSVSPQTSLKAFTPRWWYSICYDGHSHLSRGSVRHKLNRAAVIRDLRGCQRRRERGDTWRASSARQRFQPSSCRMKWMTCLALNVSLMGQQVPIWVSSAGRLEGEGEEEKKTSYQEIGNWVRQGITCHSRSKLPCVFPQRRAPHYQLRLFFSGCMLGKRKHDLICFQ